MKFNVALSSRRKWQRIDLVGTGGRRKKTKDHALVLCTLVVECCIGAVYDSIEASVMWITLSIARHTPSVVFFNIWSGWRRQVWFTRKHHDAAGAADGKNFTEQDWLFQGLVPARNALPAAAICRATAATKENLLTGIQAQRWQNKQMVKPDIFDEESSSPETWIQFYEQVCDENSWGRTLR